MTFKEQLQKDLNTVFFNCEEFAEIHCIEGKDLAVVVDNDRLNKLKKGQILGLVEADMLILGQSVDFPDCLEPGSLMNVDGRELIVTNSGKDMGLIEIALSQNRNG